MRSLFCLFALALTQTAISEVVSLPISGMSIDITPLKKISAMSREEAVRALKARGIRVVEFDQARVVNGLDLPEEIASVESHLENNLRASIALEGAFLSKGLRMGPNGVAVKEDTILLKVGAGKEIIAHEFLHYLVSQEKPRYRGSELLSSSQVEEKASEYQEAYEKMYKDPFEIPIDASPEFFRANPDGVEFLVAMHTFALYQNLLRTLEEMDVHLLLYDQKLSTSLNDLVSPAAYLYELKETSESLRDTSLQLRQKGGSHLTKNTQELLNFCDKLTPLYRLFGRDYGAAYRKLAPAHLKVQLEANLKRQGYWDLMK